MAGTPNIVIDPMTRIEGHLRIQAYAQPNGRGGGVIRDPGLSAGTMVRGVERILQGRDPRDAWALTQRICGVCTVVHGLTSVRAVENAIGIKVPRNADYIRNMMIGAQYVHDHVMHFYHLHALDWVDVVSALSANPAATAGLAAVNNPGHRPNAGQVPDTAYFRQVLEKLNGLVQRGQLGLFANGYWGHPSYRLSPEENLLLMSHYIEALGWAREVVKLHTIFGGKDPHPDLIVGGMPCTLSANPGPVDEEAGGTALDETGLAIVAASVARMQAFVDQVYLPDVLLLARGYPDWAEVGATRGNFLCYGDLPDPAWVQNEFVDAALDYPAGYLFPPGVIWSGDLSALWHFEESRITEQVAHAWYLGSDTGEHPSVTTTELNYTGPLPDGASYYMLDETDRYSWIKAPRYDGEPMEVGPLARILMMHARNTLPTDNLVQTYVAEHWTNALGFDFDQLNSTLGRIFCRMLETKIIADEMAGGPPARATGIPERAGWFQQYLANKEGPYWNPDAFSRLQEPEHWSGQIGFGFTEAPRGALGHWVKLDPGSGMIENYQCVVASQWNAGPRDAHGKEGPYERALVGQGLAEVKRPLEVLRTIHSFDPCIGCAVHILDPEGTPLVHVAIDHTLGVRATRAMPER